MWHSPSAVHERSWCEHIIATLITRPLCAVPLRFLLDSRLKVSHLPNVMDINGGDIQHVREEGRRYLAHDHSDEPRRDGVYWCSRQATRRTSATLHLCSSHSPKTCHGGTSLSTMISVNSNPRRGKTCPQTWWLKTPVVTAVELSGYYFCRTFLCEVWFY